jgi:hypothetical protein
MTHQHTLLVRKDRLSDTTQQTVLAPTLENLAPGQVLMEVDRFSLTSNNITYAAMGERLDYWSFFPAPEGMGIVPVWGFANVISSNCNGIMEGERFYGYYPMSTHLVVEPKRVRDSSFVDGASHRSHLSLIYNQYLKCSEDPLYTPDTEALQMLLRPLFTTSFLLDDFFLDNDFFGADQLILTSASSKTALGMAFLLADNRAARDHQYQIIGLTSPGNHAFVESLGCYDKVVTYEALDDIGAGVSSAIVDFAGNGRLLGELHQQLGTQLRYSCLVGLSHWDQRDGLPKELAGPRPIMFFAPGRAEKRIADWGGARLQNEVARVWEAFLAFAQHKVNIQYREGPEAVDEIYQLLLSGDFDPQAGYILRMQPE